jgi:predicted GTPase
LDDILIDVKKLYYYYKWGYIENKVKEKNTIEGSKLIKDIGNLKVYQYPDIKLVDFEEYSSISLLVVGETGIGKKNLLNSFINLL